MTWKLQSRSRIMRFDETLLRITFSEPVYVDGKLQERQEFKVPFLANVQPLNGRDLLLVPEHQRFQEQYWCYVPEPYFEKTGEIVQRNCINFQVQEVESWGSYQRVRINRVDVGKLQNP